MFQRNLMSLFLEINFLNFGDLTSNFRGQYQEQKEVTFRKNNPNSALRLTLVRRPGKFQLYIIQNVRGVSILVGRFH